MRLWPLFLLLATTLSCHAEDLGGTTPALISVSGEGSVTATPDLATVTVGVGQTGRRLLFRSSLSTIARRV